jgi:hypothetical protein
MAEDGLRNGSPRNGRGERNLSKKSSFEIKKKSQPLLRIGNSTRVDGNAYKMLFCNAVLVQYETFFSI